MFSDTTVTDEQVVEEFKDLVSVIQEGEDKELENRSKDDLIRLTLLFEQVEQLTDPEQQHKIQFKKSQTKKLGEGTGDNDGHGPTTRSVKITRPALYERTVKYLKGSAASTATKIIPSAADRRSLGIQSSVLRFLTISVLCLEDDELKERRDRILAPMRALEGAGIWSHVHSAMDSLGFLVFIMALIMLSLMSDALIGPSIEFGFAIWLIFWTEMTMRMTTYVKVERSLSIGLKRYFKEPLCLIDFVVVMLDLMGLVIEVLLAQASSPLSNVTALRLARLARGFKVCKGLRIVARTADGQFELDQLGDATQQMITDADAASYALSVLGLPIAPWAKELQLETMALLRALVVGGNAKCQKEICDVLKGRKLIKDDASDDGRVDIVAVDSQSVFETLDRVLKAPMAVLASLKLLGKDSPAEEDMLERLQVKASEALTATAMLKEFCEGHNHEFQEVIREQPDQSISYNLLRTTTLAISTFMKEERLISQHLNDDLIDYLIACLDLLAESMLGPCPANQELVVTSDAIQGIQMMVNADLDAYPAVTDVAKFFQMKRMGLVVLSSCVELRTNREAHRELLHRYETGFLPFTLIMVGQMLESDIAVELKNIVLDMAIHISGLVTEFEADVNKQLNMLGMKHKIQFKKFLRTIEQSLQSVYVVNNGMLYSINFSILPQATALRQDTKQNFMDTCDLKSSETRIKALMDRTNDFIAEQDYLHQVSSCFLSLVSCLIALISHLSPHLASLISSITRHWIEFHTFVCYAFFLPFAHSLACFAPLAPLAPLSLPPFPRLSPVHQRKRLLCVRGLQLRDHSMDGLLLRRRPERSLPLL